MVTVIVWKYDKAHPINLEDRILGGAISYFTGEPYTHVALYVNGQLYQDTIEVKGLGVLSGALKSTGLPTDKEEKVYLQLKQPIIDEAKLIAFLDGTVSNSRPYSVLKLLLFLLVYPFRWFWKLIGKVPFARFRGEVCSIYVERALEYMGIPKLDASEIFGWAAPRDFVDSSDFNTVTVDTVK